MATSAQFTAAAVIGTGVLVATADTSYTAPTHAVTVVSAAPVSVASVTTASGSQIITASSFAGVGAGWAVFGTGIAAGTTVLQTSTGTLYLSTPATASGTVTLTFVCNGIKIEELDFIGLGTTVAGVCQTYLYDGTTYHAYWPQLISVITPSTTQAPYYQAVLFPNLVLPPGWSLVATSFVANQLLEVVALGGSF